MLVCTNANAPYYTTLLPRVVTLRANTGSVLLLHANKLAAVLL